MAARNLGTIDVREYGAICDGTTDDSTAIQAAIDAAGSGATIPGGEVVISGACAIASTLTIHDKSLKMRSIGGAMGDVADGGLVWTGAEDLPMIEIMDGVGVDLSVRMAGGTNQPSAAIEVKANPTPTSPDNQSIHIHDMVIGHLPYGPQDGSTTNRVKRGILVSGTTGCDHNIVSNVEINGATVAGIDNDNAQAIWWSYDHVSINGWGSPKTPTGIKTAASFRGTSIHMVWVDVGIDTATDNAGPEVMLFDFSAEKMQQWLLAALDTNFQCYGGRLLMLDIVAGSKFGEFDSMGLKGSFICEGVHFLGMQQYFTDVAAARPILYFNSTRPRNYLRFAGNRELRHTDVSPNLGPLAEVTVVGAFTGGPDVGDYDGTFLVNDLGPNDTALRPDVIEAATTISARSPDGTMYSLTPPNGGGAATWA